MSSFGNKFIAFCLLAVVGGYAAYSTLFPTYHIRYRLSLEVEVDGKVQTSSNVIEISYQIMPDSLAFAGGAGGAFGGFMHGAALTIDLGQRGLVFVVNTRPEACAPMIANCRLLRPKGETLSALPLVAYGFPGQGLPSVMAKYLVRLQGLQGEAGPVEVPIEILPMFVRFRDLSSLQTVEEVDPGDLAATLGPGVRLLRARLQLTSDSVTPIPASWPKWLLEAKEMGNGNRPVPAKLSDELYQSYFVGD